MNKPLYIALFISILLAGCKKVEKDVRDYYPEVKTTSVEQLPDGTVKVTGEIISAGNTEIYYAGFCMDTIPMPAMLSNQKEVSFLEGNRFSIIYDELNKTQKYYFRAWAANGNGYDIADNDVSIDSVTISSSIIPCSPGMDTITFTYGTSVRHEPYLSISDIEQGQGWNINMYTYQSSSIYLTFARKPISGVYEIVSDISGNTFTAEMMVDGYQADAGAKVYVREIDANEIEVTICEAKVYDDLFRKNTITTRFRASY